MCFFPDNSAVRKETLDHERLAAVKKIVLLKVSEPSQYWIGEPVMAGAGLLSPTLALTTAEHEESDIFAKLDYTSTATEYLHQALVNAGFDVEIVKSHRVNESTFLDDYASINVNADAILDVVPIRIGFLGHNSGDRLSPEVSLVFRLVSTKDQQDIVLSNATSSSWEYEKEWDEYIREFPSAKKIGIFILGPKDYIFANKNAVNDNPDIALKRLRQTVIGAVNGIAIFLKTNQK